MKYLRVFLALSLFSVVLPSQAAAKRAMRPAIQVVSLVGYEGAQPLWYEGHFYYPLRPVIEKLGGKIIWDNTYKAAHGSLKGINFANQAFRTEVSVNGKKVILGARTYYGDFSYMVTEEFLHRVLNVDVSWDKRKQNLIIRTKR
jgi:hypothetical protein